MLLHPVRNAISRQVRAGTVVRMTYLLLRLAILILVTVSLHTLAVLVLRHGFLALFLNGPHVYSFRG
jgi:hypothetical protein